MDIQTKAMLYCSPMQCLEDKFKNIFDSYISSDHPIRESPYKLRLGMAATKLDVDLTKTPFFDEQFNFIVCSNVLDYIRNERAAIRELYRILEIGGILFLIVPIYGANTEEIETQVFNHCRRPGIDYYEQYYKYFDITFRCGEGEILGILKRR